MSEVQSNSHTGDWMALASGRQFWPQDPRVEDIHVEDIAHHLSMICRYGGATAFHYPVAQHAVLICHWLRSVGADSMTQAWGLHHDDPEAYIGDIIRPIKRDLSAYFPIEERLMSVIAERFGLTPEMPPIVQEADNRILADEARDCLRLCVVNWTANIQPLGVEILPWTNEQARDAYLREHYRLVEEIANG